MKPLNSDTAPEVERLLIEGYRTMSPSQKIQQVLRSTVPWNASPACAYGLSRLRAQYGEAMPEREVRLRLASLHLDREVMVTVFGWDPDVEGY